MLLQKSENFNFNSTAVEPAKNKYGSLAFLGAA